MGIHELSKVIGDNASDAMKEHELGAFFGRRVAIDASMQLYQFLIALRQVDGIQSFTDANGETTSHIIGMFYRTIRLMTAGIKPVYVFDGKPPELKSGELEKRRAKAEEAAETLESAVEAGDEETAAKFAKRTTRVTKEQNDDVKKLLELMGVPFVEAPGEAEAQCAALCKAGLCWATGSEDMDSLPLGATVLLRRLNVSESKKLPILQIDLDRVLAGLEMDMDQFIDLCILLGCDYCDTIPHVGRVTAVKLIKQYGCIEKILEAEKGKYKAPANFPYEAVRKLFKNPDVIPNPETLNLKQRAPNEEGLLKFLVEEKGFNEMRVKAGIAKLKKIVGSSVQSRVDSFFTALPPAPSPKKTSSTEPKKPPTKKSKKS